MTKVATPKISFLFLIVLCILLSGQIIQSQQNNLLANPGFESPYKADNAGRVVADGWQAWNKPKTTSTPNHEVQPEYAETAPETDRIRSGSNAQSIYTDFYYTYNAGVYQAVDGIVPGTELRFSTYAWVWSSALDDREISENPGDVIVFVGIDPTGGTNPVSSDIVWSPPAPEQYDAYRQYSVIASAEAESVTVYVRVEVGLAVRNNFVFLDDAVLEITPSSPVQLTDTPAPTSDDVGIIATNTNVPPSPTSISSNTPAPTFTRIPSVTSVPSNTPIPLPTNTPEDATPTQEGSTNGPDVIPTNTPIPTNAATNTPIPTSVPETSGEFPTSVNYVVKSGDTVGKIAFLYGSTIEAIIEANGLNDDALIFVGQELIVPVPILVITATPSPTPEQPTATSVPSPFNEANTYVVQPGDTLYRIAAQFNTTVSQLAFNNGITNPNRIQAGQRLTVPGAGGENVSVPQQPTQPVRQPATYIIQRGDTLYRLSLRFNVTTTQLANANGITNANRIFAGQVLKIP